jgi:hypothetical protein
MRLMPSDASAQQENDPYELNSNCAGEAVAA